MLCQVWFCFKTNIYPKVVLPGGVASLSMRMHPATLQAHIVQELFEEHDEFKVLPSWPPHFPDLNPVEHLWDVNVLY